MAPRVRLPPLRCWLASVLLVVLAPGLAKASISPGVTPPGTAGPRSASDRLAATNAAIAARSEAAIAAGVPTKMLVTFRIPEQLVAAQAGAVQQSAGAQQMAAGDILNAARSQVYAAVKARVLHTVAPATNALASTSTGGGGDGDGTAGAAAAAPTTTAPQAGGVRVLTDYAYVPVTLVSISSSADLARLRANPEVASVVANGVVRPMEMNGLGMIGQPAVLAAGYQGVGTVVTLDTGLIYTRDAFGPCTAPGVPAATCKVLYMEDLASNDGALDVPGDQGEYHGTNVAGIIVGVAPGAKLISLDIFGADGTGDWNTLIAAMDWTIANRTKFNITVVNMSLGGSYSPGPCDDDPLSASIATAWASGIMSAVASGNEGWTDSLSYPACASKAVSVGAVYTMNVSGKLTWTLARDPADGGTQYCTDTNPRTDQVTCFTNSNSQLTMLGPGYEINAAGEVLSGTSQATPFVAGSITVLRQRYPSYSLQQILDKMTSTGDLIKDTRNNVVKPRLNLAAAAGFNTTNTTCTVAVTPSSLAAPAAGGSYALQVTPSAATCAWTLSVTGGAWVSPSATSGTGPASVSLAVGANTGAARTVVITVAAADGMTSATLQQGAAAAANGSGEAVSFVVKVTGLVAGKFSMELKWAPSQVARAAVASSAPAAVGYRVMWNAGLAAPQPYCTTGTAVTSRPRATPNRLVRGGTVYSARVRGLRPAQRYAFRVCAVDGSGAVSRGTVWRGSTLS